MNILETLLGSEEPSIRYLALTGVLGEDPRSPDMIKLRDEIRSSPRVRGLLGERTADGEIPCHPYAKWFGAHWVLVSLAELGYPPGDQELIPLREQVLAWLLGEEHRQSVRSKTIAGRVRMCASMEGNALYALCALDLADERAARLAGSLLAWQWQDGGWNCDKHPEADTSSFMETLTPLRGLAYYARRSGDPQARAACQRAAEVFLSRRLYKRRSTGEVIRREFTRLHYPCYWHYDILFGLKVLAEAGFSEPSFAHDERCQEALDLLKSKRLPDGGFPAEASYYKVSPRRMTGCSRVDWGGTSQRKANPWVTVDALGVLKAAGSVS